MASLDEQIPAFPLWIALNDTMALPEFFKKEGSVTKLATIIKSSTFETTFVFEKDPLLTHNEYCKIAEMYKSFTCWILGRFFHAMGNEKLYKVHESLIDIQKYILEQLAHTQPNIWMSFVCEYGKALNLLSHYNIGKTLDLKILVPKEQKKFNGKINLNPLFVQVTSEEACQILLQNITKIFIDVLPKCFQFDCFSKNIVTILEDYLVLIQKGNPHLNLSILKLYTNINENMHVKLSRNIDLILRKFQQYFENIICDFYVRNPGKFNEDQEKFLEDIIRQYLNNCDSLGDKNKSIRLTKILHETVSTNNESDEFIDELVPYFQQLEFNVDGEHCVDFFNQYSMNFHKICVIKNKLKRDILNKFPTMNIGKVLRVYDPNVSETWCQFHEIIQKNMEKHGLHLIIEIFNKVSSMLLELTFEIMNELNDTHLLLIYYNETNFFFNIIGNLNRNLSELSLSTNFFTNYVLLSNSSYVDFIFWIISNSWLKDFQLPVELIRNIEMLKDTQALYTKLTNRNISYDLNELKNAISFMKIIASGLVKDLTESQISFLQEAFFEICKAGIRTDFGRDEVLNCIPHLANILPSFEKFLNQFLMTGLEDNSKMNQKMVLMSCRNVLCSAYSDYVKIVSMNDKRDILINLYCETCDLNSRKNAGEKCNEKFVQKGGVVLNFRQNRLDVDNLCKRMMKKCLAILCTNDSDLRIFGLNLIPSISCHSLDFNTKEITGIWIEKIEDDNVEVRKKFAKIVFEVLRNLNENSKVPTQTKIEIQNLIMNKLENVTKKSLKYSKFELQLTVIETIKSLIDLKSISNVLPILKMIIHFIMVPTSKYSVLASNKLYYLAETLNKSPNQLCSSYMKEICETIAHLCVVNLISSDYSLKFSLKNIKIIFDTDFVNSGNQYLLPYLVSKINSLPQAEKLIEEMAGILDVELPELLASNYGYIFVHTFLNQKTANYKNSMKYLERTTGINGQNLRRKNFKVILNNLLLHFHSKNREVVLALNLLANEDTEKRTTDIAEYLHWYFLGVLQIFLTTLMSNSNSHENTLESLSDIFSFMGSKHITPLRFKIISMLQTINYKKYPILYSRVWFTFLKCCEVEMLGPQLATIFKSLQPLIEICPSEINEIFKYLICDNETKLNDYIKDLFFMKHSRINTVVLNKLNEYLSEIEQYSFKEKLRWLLKYLSHETMEIRVEALGELKILMEKNREELDRIILGYNGIDESIVELVDVLTITCREKDENLKLACAEVFGELGALEPSHLPRRYTHDTRVFSYFIDEDSFIINALNELLKALQVETNAVNMDRPALAIQEILKTYEISPDERSSKHSIWNQFTESQQELMKPLLSSRYISALDSSNIEYPIPIYGSIYDTSFQTWLYHFACSLVSKLSPQRKLLLKACLPSMKEGERVLMHFLPYILLHVLMETTEHEMVYEEFQAVLTSFSVVNELDYQTLSIVTVPFPSGSSALTSNISKEFWKTKCSKTVFILLDFLDRWLREWLVLKKAAGREDQNFHKIRKFLSRFCKLQLAKCNYQCGEFPRALMHLEEFITENPVEMAENLSLLAEIYAHLDEPDGVTGTMALRQTEPSLEDRILALEVSGKLTDAAACYERIKPPLKLHHLQGLIQCYLDLDNANTALNFAYGAMSTYPEYKNVLTDLQAEPLWRLGRFDILDDFLDKPEMRNNKSWGVQIGKALIHFDRGERDEFKETLNFLKLQQVESLGAASVEEGAYQHGYGYISRLHSINEIEKVEKMINQLLSRRNDDELIRNVVNKLKGEWELRIKVVQESVKIVEPILCLRRVALERGKVLIRTKVPTAVPLIESLMGECWLLSAKTARSAKIHQQAYTYTLKAEEYNPSELFIEKAQLHWLREENELALSTLNRGLSLLIPNSNSPNLEALTLQQRKLCAEARLLIATYNDSTSNVEAEVMTQNYKSAYDVYKGWEKSLVCLAQHFDRKFQTYSDLEKDSKTGTELQLLMIRYFGISLYYGSTYVYQSLPRLLSIWFDYGTRLLDVTQPKIREERRNILSKMSMQVNEFLEKVPVYIFLTAFSQLVSRICHPMKEVHVQLKDIIIKLLLHYPQQTLWMMIPVIKSSYAMRAKRCSEILNDPRLRNSAITNLIKDFTLLAEKLIELCNKELPDNVSAASVNTLLKSLPRLLSKSDFSEIMIPTQKFRKLVLPNPVFKSSEHHNPFPNQYVHIVGIEDEMIILSSLQRPRRITFRGSDGKGYVQMLKPKDDLRKDFRLMEFNDIVNQLLTRDAEARERRLNIRLYSVAPLNEECGLIEWVSNLIGLRVILMSLYHAIGLGMKYSELREIVPDLRAPLAKKRDVFLKRLLVRHPPVLGEWFRKNFPDAQSWLTARTAFIRTTAVMSMVGYIFGLGDRHGENILLDSISGDIVHVDFNCLFNKGESLEYPERVPFRLTHNMVSAMGPLGVEGMFRKSCVCTLNTLRTNTTTLMSIVTPFVYDPLVSWPRVQLHTSGAERTNEQAVEHIKNIELRLKGNVKTRGKTQSLSSLSVEGQTNHLIKEAVDVDNLCQMYYGWGPYL